MKTLKIEKNKTLMIAHRGLSGFERENTIAAFIAAGNQSYYGCECDIHPTIDKKFVVIHDSDTERVAGVSKIVEESTYDELQKIELLSLQTNQKESHLKIPTLEEYVLCCKRYGKKCIVEFKHEFIKEDVFKVINIINSLEYLHECIFISFNYKNLLYVQEYDKELPCQYLMTELDDEKLNICIEHKLKLKLHVQYNLNVQKSIVLKVVRLLLLHLEHVTLQL